MSFFLKKKKENLVTIS